MKIVLFGAGEGVGSALQRLLSEDQAEVVLVVTRDHAEWIATVARNNKHPCEIVSNVNDPAFIERIRGLNPDLLCNWGWTQRFSQALIETARLGAMNYHPGILPNGRGSGAVQGEMWNGATELGGTCHFMNGDFDSGRIIDTMTFPIPGEGYLSQIESRYKGYSADFFVRSVYKAFEEQEFPEIMKFGRYFPKFAEGDDVIDWNQTADLIVRKVRSRSPNRLSKAYVKPEYAELQIKRISVAEHVEPYISVNGQVIDRGERGTLVKTADTAVWIEQARWEDGGFFTPTFKIGTCLFTITSGEIIKFIKLLGNAPDETLDPVFHCKCGEARKSKIVDHANGVRCVTCGSKYAP